MLSQCAPLCYIVWPLDPLVASRDAPSAASVLGTLFTIKNKGSNSIYIFVSSTYKVNVALHSVILVE